MRSPRAPAPERAAAALSPAVEERHRNQQQRQRLRWHRRSRHRPVARSRARDDERVSRPRHGRADEEHVADDPSRGQIGGWPGDNDDARQRDDEPRARPAARSLPERGPCDEGRHDRDQARNEHRSVARGRVPHAVEEEEVVREHHREAECEYEWQIRPAGRRTREPDRRAHSQSRPAAHANRDTAITAGGTCSAATFPAGHVPPNATMPASSVTYAVRCSSRFATAGTA